MINQNKYYRFLLVICCTIYVLSKMSVLCKYSFRISKFHTCPAKNSKFLTIVDHSLEQCVGECTRRTSCKAIGFKRLFRLCELHAHGTSPAFTDKHCVMVLRNDMDERPSLCNCNETSVCEEETRRCPQKECPPEQHFFNVTFRGNMNEVNANKSVKCQDGFFEVTDKNSEKYATCSQFGRWSFVPQCEECPKDGEVIRGFQFFSKKMTHQRASMFCSKRNASLVKIRETGKFMYIRSIIKTCNYKQLWTDGKKINDVWKYSDDDVVPQNDEYWNRDVHNNATCLRIHHRFLGKSCNASLGYICEFL